MNRKVSRNERHKYSNEEKLALGEYENTSAIINITQDDDSNSSELLQNLCINNLWFYHLKMFYNCFLFLFFFDFIHKCLYYCCFQWLDKGKKSTWKASPLPPAIKILRFFPIPSPPLLPTWLLVFDIFSNHPYYSTSLSIRDLRVFGENFYLSPSYKKISFRLTWES